MTLNIICERETGFSFDYKEIANSVIKAALEYEQFPYEAEVNLTLSNDDYIKEINQKFRQIDSSTDVLSFPMLDYKQPADFTQVEDQWEDCINPDTGEVMLGDIVISVEHVAAQAKEYGHSQLREYAFLIVHSMLHLFGYDHMIPEDAKLMESHQKEILSKLGIERDSKLE